MEPQVDDPGEYALGTSAGAALVAGGVPEDVIRTAPECSGATHREGYDFLVLAHSTPRVLSAVWGIATALRQRGFVDPDRPLCRPARRTRRVRVGPV